MKDWRTLKKLTELLKKIKKINVVLAAGVISPLKEEKEIATEIETQYWDKINVKGNKILHNVGV